MSDPYSAERLRQLRALVRAKRDPEHRREIIRRLVRREREECRHELGVRLVWARSQ